MAQNDADVWQARCVAFPRTPLPAGGLTLVTPSGWLNDHWVATAPPPTDEPAPLWQSSSSHGPEGPVSAAVDWHPDPCDPARLLDQETAALAADGHAQVVDRSRGAPSGRHVLRQLVVCDQGDGPRSVEQWCIRAQDGWALVSMAVPVHDLARLRPLCQAVVAAMAVDAPGGDDPMAVTDDPFISVPSLAPAALTTQRQVAPDVAAALLSATSVSADLAQDVASALRIAGAPEYALDALTSPSLWWRLDVAGAGRLGRTHLLVGQGTLTVASADRADPEALRWGVSHPLAVPAIVAAAVDLTPRPVPADGAVVLSSRAALGRALVAEDLGQALADETIEAQPGATPRLAAALGAAQARWRLVCTMPEGGQVPVVEVIDCGPHGLRQIVDLGDDGAVVGPCSPSQALVALSAAMPREPQEQGFVSDGLRALLRGTDANAAA